MPELANPVQQRETIVEIRPYRGGWQCFEAPGVEPRWTGENAKQSATIMPKPVRSLGAERFGSSARTSQLNAPFNPADAPLNCKDLSYLAQNDAAPVNGPNFECRVVWGLGGKHACDILQKRRLLHR